MASEGDRIFTSARARELAPEVGLSEQAPRRVFVLTTTDAVVPRHRGAAAAVDRDGYRVAGTSYPFVQVRPERFFGTEKVWIGEARVTITDPERTLLDGLAMPRYCGDFAEVLHAFEVRGANAGYRCVNFAAGATRMS